MKNRILTLLLAIAVFAIPIQAQFNFKKLGKEIKQGVERQAERKVKESTQKKANKVLDIGQEKSEKESGKVSESTQAGSADPQGSATTVSGEQNNDAYSLEDALRRYDNLDPAVYYVSQVGRPSFFNHDNEESAALLRIDMLQFLRNRAGGKDAPLIVVSEKNDFAAPCGERAINAYMAAFAAYAPSTYFYFAGARSMIDPIVKGEVPLNFEPVNIIQARVTPKGDGTYDIGYGLTDYARKYGYGFKDALMAAPPGMKDGNIPVKRIKRWKDERDRLMKVYQEKVSFETVAQALRNTVNLIGEMSEKQMWADCAAYSYWADVIAADFQSHPKKENSEKYKGIWDNYKRFADEGFPAYRQLAKEQWQEWYASYKSKEKLTNDVPKAKRSDPKLEAEMLAVARTVYDDGRVALKALIQSPDWAYDRTALGQIINRNQSAYIIYRMPNGKHRAIELGFKQMYNGSSYGKTQLRGIGTRDFEVDYK